jgi:hypothetical protein
MKQHILFLALACAIGYSMADVPVCNPFSKYEDVQHYSTCKNSAIEYGAFGGNLTVAASLSDCGKTNGTSEISAYFADKRLKLVPAESYIFEYTISTTSKYGSCIVALQTADGATILDQNGIANSPEAVSLNDNIFACSRKLYAYFVAKLRQDHNYSVRVIQVHEFSLIHM